jgi:hypothetical protein
MTAPTLADATTPYRRSYGLLAAHLPEIIAVRAGLKRALQVTLGNEETRRREDARIRTLCDRAGLHCRFHVRHGRHKVILAKDVVEPPGEDEDENKDNFFDYPDCCLEKFNANPLSCHTVRHVRDLIEHGRRYPFLVNPFLSSTPFHLVCWQPCSLDCPSTHAFAARLYEVVQSRVPALGRGIRHWNQRTVLFTDVCGIGLCFAGRLRENILRHRGCDWIGVPSELLHLAPGTGERDLLLFDRIVTASSKSDEVEWGPSSVIFRRAGTDLDRVERPSHLAMAWVEFCE